MSEAYSPIPELNLLKEFDDQLMDDFSDGFELREYGYDAGLVEWLDMEGSEDPRLPELLDQLIPFAQATGSGSFYALWRCDDRADLATLPVIFFGDEGDLAVVARGLRDLFRLLAIDSEFYDFGEDDEHTPGHEEYLTWLAQNFGLTLPEDEDIIVGPAMAKYGRRFADWLLQFAPDHAVENLLKQLDTDRPMTTS